MKINGMKVNVLNLKKKKKKKKKWNKNLLNIYIKMTKEHNKNKN